MFHARVSQALLLLCTVLSLTACAQKIADQPKIKPLTASDFFADGQSARPLPLDTVSRSDLYNDELLTTGKVDGKFADLFPYPITRDTLLRGQTLFNTFCSVCHDRTGSANGMVVQNGYASPPVLYSDEVLAERAGIIFSAITNGYFANDEMPSYASQIAVRDRWAIVAYVRALQLSQHATLDDVPSEERAALEAQP